MPCVVVAYVRQSDEEGHKKELSCPFQQERFLADVERRRAAGEDVTYEIAPWDEGKSGGDIDRPGLNWVLSNLDRFDELWVYDHDRLVRHHFFAAFVMEELRSRGVRLWVSTGGADETTPMGRFMTDLRLRFGALYREQVAERTRENLNTRLRQGLWMNHAPAGYTFAFERGEGSRRILIPDPGTADTVREMFRLLANGMSQKQAALQLGMNETSLLWWRQNPLYIGLVYKYRKNVKALSDLSYAALWALAENPAVDWLHPGQHEPLVEQPIWDKVQRLHTDHPCRGRRRSTNYALSGMIRCAHCGRTTVLRPSGGPRSRAVWCEHCGWQRSYRYAEATVLSVFAMLTADDKFEEALEAEIRSRDVVTRLEQQLAGLTRQREQAAGRLDRTIEAMLDTDDLSPALRTKARELQAHIHQLDEEIAKTEDALERQTNVGEWRHLKHALLDLELLTLWNEATEEQRREVLSSVFTDIRATREKMTFAVRGLHLPIEVEWRTYIERMVAGAGFEPATFGL